MPHDRTSLAAAGPAARAERAIMLHPVIIEQPLSIALYLDEASVEPIGGFPNLKRSLESLMNELASATQRNL